MSEFKLTPNLISVGPLQIVLVIFISLWMLMFNCLFFVNMYLYDLCSMVFTIKTYLTLLLCYPCVYENTSLAWSEGKYYAGSRVGYYVKSKYQRVTVAMSHTKKRILFSGASGTSATSEENKKFYQTAFDNGPLNDLSITR